VCKGIDVKAAGEWVLGMVMNKSLLVNAAMIERRTTNNQQLFS
jgi:hypothetical protein